MLPIGKKAISALSVLAALLAASPAIADVAMVRNGKAAAVVVTARNPSRTATYAAEELVRHVERATSVKLQVVTEDAVPGGIKSRIFVGVTDGARQNRIELEKLGPDECFLRTIGNDLFVLGKEDKEISPMQGVIYDNSVLPSGSVNSCSGTLFGVYEILHRYVRVRWLWPGELGTYIPVAKNIAITKRLDEKIGPKLQFRLWSWSHIALARRYQDRYKPEVRKLAFTSEGIVRYRDDLEVYLRRHRLGISQVSPHGVHTFHWWWGRYGKTHPDWFRLNSKGERGPEPGQSSSAMCVSNPGLHKFIVERYLAGDLYVTGWAPPDRIRYAGYIPLGETDAKGGCNCEDCRKWNGPQPEKQYAPAKAYYSPLLANRYARFWKSVYDLAVEKAPDVKISVLLYWNTFPAPTENIKLNQNFWGEFAPWIASESYYPMPEDAERWLQEQWLGWRKTGMSLVYRPNYPHCGYVMPHLSTWQAGEFFRWAYRNGMVAAYYDSLYGHWATRGPMMYMLMRLFWDPDLRIADVRKEYFSGFGPAAEIVERYFDYWEQHATTRKGGWLHGDVDRAYVAFPPSVFPPAEALLQDALQAARKHPLSEFAERVRFLQAGLEHARMAAEFMALLHPVSPWSGSVAPLDNPERLAEIRTKLKRLIDFRRENEGLYFSDLLDAATRENSAVRNMADLLKDIP